MTALSDLIARLEAAKEGSRELDAELHPTPAWYDKHSGDWCAQYGDTAGWVEVPHYTTSLDAALTLVPKGWFWHVGVIARSKLATTYWARLSDDEIIHKYDGEDEQGSTAPLALCIAALKAREAAR